MAAQHAGFCTRYLSLLCLLALLLAGLGLAPMPTHTASSTITITVDTLTDANSNAKCSLRIAVATVNTGAAQAGCLVVGVRGPVNYVIVFDSTLFPAYVNETLTLLHGVLALTKPVTITGRCGVSQRHDRHRREHHHHHQWRRD